MGMANTQGTGFHVAPCLTFSNRRAESSACQAMSHAWWNQQPQCISALLPLHAFMISCIACACLLLLFWEMPVSLSFKISNTRSEPHDLRFHFVPFSFSPTLVAGGAVSDPSPFSRCVPFELPPQIHWGFFHLIPFYVSDTHTPHGFQLLHFLHQNLLFSPCHGYVLLVILLSFFMLISTTAIKVLHTCNLNVITLYIKQYQSAL